VVRPTRPGTRDLHLKERTARSGNIVTQLKGVSKVFEAEDVRIVTHDSRHAGRAERIIHMLDGRIVASSTGSDPLAGVPHVQVATSVHGAPSD
jgi:hypothetical protein